MKQVLISMLLISVVVITLFCNGLIRTGSVTNGGKLGTNVVDRLNGMIVGMIWSMFFIWEL